MRDYIVRLARKIEMACTTPDRSEAWLAGWHDAAHKRGRNNPHKSGADEHEQYEAGYQHWLNDPWAERQFTEAQERGWDDNERDGINRNPFASGTPDWSDYERGFAGYQSWFNQQW